jgi:uncharacterized protein DUF3467
MHEERGGQVQIVWPEDAMWPQGGYANVVMVNHTPWDFTLRMGMVVLPALPPGAPIPPEGVQTITTPIAQVTMPPQALRQLARVLQEQLAKYAATYGQIEPLAGEG